MRQVIILFLIRRRFKLKKGELFQFTNQREKNDWYYFSSTNIVKMMYRDDYPDPLVKLSDVSLNWLLDDRCQIIKKEV